MKKRPLSLLEGALLGLLHDEQRSGYALRKLFATTPMGNFSDSPGSIYPALGRLATQGRIAGSVENARSLRPRQVYRLTAAGLEALEGWLREPMVPGGMREDFSALLLRFVFMPQTIGRAETVRFMATLEIELKRQVAERPKGKLGDSSGASLHAKTFGVDRARIFIGSFNLDPRSARLNTEVGVVLDSASLATQLSDAFDRNIPRLAYEVRLTGDGQGVEWIEATPSGEVRHSSTPGAGPGRMLYINLLRILPIEWLL